MLQARGAEALGLDPEPECVAAASQVGQCKQGSIEDIKTLFSPGSFDVVVCSHVLEHLPSPYEALMKMSRLRARRYVFAVPNVVRGIRVARALAGSAKPDHEAHLFGWGRPEFTSLLRSTGFLTEGWYADRVTLLAGRGSFGALLTRALSCLETNYLPRLAPLLSSSLIVSCRSS